MKVQTSGGVARYPAVPAVAGATYDSVNLFGPDVEATLLWAADTPFFINLRVLSTRLSMPG